MTEDVASLTPGQTVKLKGIIRVVRPPHWLLLCIIFLLWMIALLRYNGAYNLGLMGLGLLTVALIAAGGFTIDDYFDHESDAIVRPEQPITSHQITPLGAVQFSVVMFLAALGVALSISLLALGIAALAIVFSILYPGLFKKRSGFLSNIFIGLFVGISIPLSIEAVLFHRISVISVSFVSLSMVAIAVNVIKDVTGLEGDMKIGLSTLAAKRGTQTAIRVGALFYLFAAITSPLPYVVGVVSIAYLIPIALLGLTMLNSRVSLFRKPDVQNVERQRRSTLTATLPTLLFPTALVAGIVLLH